MRQSSTRSGIRLRKALRLLMTGGLALGTGMVTSSRQAEAMPSQDSRFRYEIPSLDHDFTIADDFHSRKLGLYIMQGFPDIAFPAVDPRNHKQYYLHYAAIGAPGKGYDVKFNEISRASDVTDYTLAFTDTFNTIDQINADLASRALSRQEILQRHYAAIYTFTSTDPWERKVVAGMNQRVPLDQSNESRLPIELRDFKKLAEQHIAALLELDDGTLEFSRIMEEARMMEIGQILDYRLRRKLFDHDVSAQEATDYAKDNNVVSITREACGIMNNLTNMYQRGEMGLSSFLITRQIFDLVVRSVADAASYASTNGKGGGEMYTILQDASRNVLDTVDQMNKAMGPVESFPDQQVRHMYVVWQRNALRLTEYIAKFTSSDFLAKHAEETHLLFPQARLASMTSTIMANIDRLYARYTNADMGLRGDPKATFDQFKVALAPLLDAKTNYALVATHANVGLQSKLAGLLASVHQAHDVWSTANKAQLKALYLGAYGDPDAEGVFLAQLSPWIEVAPPQIQTRVAQVSHDLRTHNVEGPNGPVATHVFPTVLYTLRYTVTNRLPLGVQGALQLWPTGVQLDKAEQRFVLPAGQGSTLQVVASRDVAVGERVDRPNPLALPKVSIRLTMNDLRSGMDALPTP